MLNSQSSPNLRPESNRHCSMVLLFRESITAPRIVLTLCTTCCARTHSIAIDLITSKIRYYLWFTAELFKSRLHAWLTHARYANSTNQNVRQTQVHSESSAGQNMESWHPGSVHMRGAPPSPPRTVFQNTGISPKLQSNILDCKQGTDCLANGDSTNFNCIKASQQFFIACYNP